MLEPPRIGRRSRLTPRQCGVMRHLAGGAYLVDDCFCARLEPPVRLFTTISRQGVVAIWPCKLPGADGRPNAWHDTALQAAELAMSRWTRIVADMGLGGYQPYTAAGDLPDPEWPEQTFPSLLKIAFGAFYIDRPDHPVIRRLQGLV